MARVKYYLDTRKLTSDGKAHLKLSLSHNKTSALIQTGIFIKPEYWEPGNESSEPHIKRTCARYKAMNTLLKSKMEAVSNCIFLLDSNGELREFESATQLKNFILQKIDGRGSMSFTEYYSKFIENIHNAGTKESHRWTLAKINKFTDNRLVAFAEITTSWLNDFEKFMADIKINSRWTHLKNIRTVLNSAINEDVTDIKYPFRRFTLKTESTPKRSLTIEQIRELRDYDCEPHQAIYRDMFMLIFYLRGINIVDLSNLKEIRNGRIEYVRAKTGKLYSVKVEPEAMEIIERYRGKDYLLNILDRYSDYRQFRKQMNRNLGQIGPMERKGRGGKKERTPILPEITSYWARHSVATIAANLDVPKETISAMLGHGGNTVTDIYIDFDQRKADDAMRKVIDAIA